jgi:hypothetical protein
VAQDRSALELSIVMPCLDEARTVGACVATARRFLEEHGVAGEVIVADNGSRDGSCEAALAQGARVVQVAERGYGAALAGGIAAARGRFVLMGDSDDSYDYADLRPFLRELRGGADLVMGNRFRGGIAPGAMRPLHRYVGNPGLTAAARLLFGLPCGDVYCGQRAFRSDLPQRLGLEARGMEYALEMLIKAQLAGLRIREVPVTLRPDGRGRRSHLRTFRDGWRSLRLYLQFSPRWLFLYPGLLLVALGLALGALHGTPLGLAGCAAAVALGAQGVSFGLLGRFQAIAAGLHPFAPAALTRLRGFQLELWVAGGLALAAVAASALAWAGLHDGVDHRLVLLAAVGTVLGGQVSMSSFYMGLLQRQLLREDARRRA